MIPEEFSFKRSIMVIHFPIIQLYILCNLFFVIACFKILIRIGIERRRVVDRDGVGRIKELVLDLCRVANWV